MTDDELRSFKIGGMDLKDCTSITFLGWVAGKINGLPSGNPFLSELGMMISNPPMGKMTVENKIEVIRKLEKLGVEIK